MKIISFIGLVVSMTFLIGVISHGEFTNTFHIAIISTIGWGYISYKEFIGW
jgi:hypothetical protein